MTAPKRTAVALLVLLLLGGGIAWLVLDARDGAPAAPPAHEIGPAAPDRDGPGLSGTPDGAPDVGVPAPPAEAPPPEPGTAPTVHPIHFAGRVLDPEGRPLPDVPVRLHATRESGIALDPTVPFAETRSGDDGTFAIDLDTSIAERDPQGPDRWLRVHVVATHPRWQFAAVSYNVSTTDGNADTRTHEGVALRFREPFRIACAVHDAAGRPIGGALITWGGTGDRTERPDGGWYEARTDGDGRAELVLPVIEEPASIFLHTAGVRVVHATAPGYARATSEPIRILEPKPGQRVEVDVVMEPAAVIAGRAVDDLGEPVPDCPLDLLLRREGGGGGFWNDRLGNRPVTDAEGRFEVRDAPPGEWELHVWSRGHEEHVQRIRVPVRDLTLQLRRDTFLVVHYRDPDGTPRWVDRFEVSDAGDDEAWMSGTWGGEEPLELSELRPGRQQLRVWLCGRAQPFVHEVEVSTGTNEPVRVTVPKADGRVLRGRLLDHLGVPTAGYVTLRPADAPSYDEDAQLDHPVDETGAFRYEGLTPGTWVVWAEAPYHAPAEVEVVVPLAQDPPTVDVRLGIGATVRVRLPAPPADGSFRWQLQVLQADGETVEQTTPETDADGWVELAMLPVGRTTIMLESTTFRAEPVPSDPYVAVLECVEGQTAEYGFPRVSGVTATGRVLDAKGAPFAQRTLLLRRVPPDHVPARDAPTVSYGWKRLVTDDAGRFEARGLLPGRYVVGNVRRDGLPIAFEVPADGGPPLELRAR